jgi:MarR family transcriptional regulator, transcriptional regulator for hemolysin
LIDIPKDLAENLIFIINQTSKEQISQFDDQMQALDLDKAQWRILGYLIYFENINQSELAKLLGVGKAPLGQLIHKLEQAGWVQRRPSQSDRRSYNLGLSERLKEIAALIKKLMELEAERLLTGLDEQERESVKRTLRTIRRNIDDVRPSDEINDLKSLIAVKMACLT